MKRLLATLGPVLLLGLACTTEDDPHEGDTATSGSPDYAGAICEAPADCYPEVDPADLSGPALCLDRVRGGYCTHECAADMDCCAAEGECATAFPQVCSPFESTGMMMCFLSCEDDDVDGSGHGDPETFCQSEASPDFICRSSGGGNENRKVCVPGDCGVGAGCVDDADCAAGHVCLTDIDGGYCGARDCNANADCPDDTVCVAGSDFNYCARRCGPQSDCTFCRHPDDPATCTNEDVTYVDDPEAPTVCVLR
jgi:hypothetical protein